MGIYHEFLKQLKTYTSIEFIEGKGNVKLLNRSITKLNISYQKFVSVETIHMFEKKLLSSSEKYANSLHYFNTF